MPRRERRRRFTGATLKGEARLPAVPGLLFDGILPAGSLSGLRERGPGVGDQRRPGVVYATTAVHSRDGEPYNVALVDLEEGIRMMSRVEGIPAEEVEVGRRVRFEVREEDDGPVAVFVPMAEPEEPEESEEPAR